MAKLYYFCLGLLVLLGAGCSSGDEFHSTQMQETSSAYLTIDEAKLFFETQCLQFATRSNQASMAMLSPGDFTPQWQKAQISENESIASVDIPIISHNRYGAILSEYTENHAKASFVRIAQKLIVVKDKKTDILAQYILTLVPEKEYYDKNKNANVNRFLNSGDKGGFSGIAIYTHPEFNIPIRINKYKNGIKIGGVFIPAPKDVMLKNIEKAKQLIGNIRIGRVNTVITRSDGEYGGYGSFDEWLHGLFDQIPDGVDYHYDMSHGDNGTWVHWYDSNGNIINHSFYPDPNPSPSNPQEPEEPEEPTEENTDQVCPYCGSEFCDGSCQPREEPENPEGGSGITNPNNPDKDTKPQPTSKPDVNLMNKDKFVGYGSEQVCIEACKAILNKYGITYHGSPASVFKLTYETRNPTRLERYGTNPIQNYTNAINCIDRHLDAGRPIIVGVNHTLEQNINEKATDHFVVINGRGYDSKTGTYYYTYYEVGKSDRDIGCDNAKNRLIYDPKGPSFYDAESSRSERERYDVTQVRPNDGDTTGTVPQNAN